MPRATPNDPVLASNKKAFHDYTVLDKYEVGIQLTGTEVKSCRDRAVQLGEGFVKIINNQAFLFNVHISVYGFGNRFNHDPKRNRKLLVHAGEIRELKMKTEAKGLTLVPLKIFLRHGRIKVDLGVCRGRQLHDKREALRKKAMDRDRG